jgi:hypothetical protein
VDKNLACISEQKCWIARCDTCQPMDACSRIHPVTSLLSIQSYKLKAPKEVTGARAATSSFFATVRSSVEI